MYLYIYSSWSWMSMGLYRTQKLGISASRWPAFCFTTEDCRMKKCPSQERWIPVRRWMPWASWWDDFPMDVTSDGCFFKPLLISPQKMNELFMVIPTYKWLIITDWWFGTMEFYDFPIILGMENHPNWRTPSFFRGVGIPPDMLLTKGTNMATPRLTGIEGKRTQWTPFLWTVLH